MAAALFALVAGPACAQDIALNGGPTGAVPVAQMASVNAGAPAPRTSRHPLMEPAAIEAAEANFATCVQAMWPAAQSRGVSRRTFEAATRGLTPDMRIMTLLDTQPEFERPIWDYVNGMVSETRVQRGREMLARHKATFDAVEQRFGVDRFLIAAIWGVESSYGAGIGERSVVRSTATLACIGRRQEFFRNEFLATLQILEADHVPLANLRGSWAGAFGHTQFMPDGFLRHAVDFDGDGKANLVESIPDVIASTANRFRNEGWRFGHAWGYEVRVPERFNYLLAGREREMTVAEWERLGVARANGQGFPRRDERAYLYVPAGAQGPKFLMLNNFRAIFKYNPAEAYALSVGHLADRLRGGGGFVQAWPTHERMLSRTERFELQTRLGQRGHDVGEPDGKLGSRTRAAVRDFQAAVGLVPDGFPTAALLQRLRQN